MCLQIKISVEQNKAKISLLPCPIDFLNNNLDQLKIKTIEKINIGVFNLENEDDYYYITNDNYLDIIGEINSINNLTNFLKPLENNYCYNIYKFFFTIDEIEYFFDDDNLLEIEFSINNLEELYNSIQNISKKYFEFYESL